MGRLPPGLGQTKKWKVPPSPLQGAADTGAHVVEVMLSSLTHLAWWEVLPPPVRNIKKIVIQESQRGKV